MITPREIDPGLCNFNQQLVLTSGRDAASLVSLAEKLWSPPDKIFEKHSQNSRVTCQL